MSTNKRNSKIKAWIQASRPPFYIATIIPLTVGLVLSRPLHFEDIIMFGWINIAAFMVHLATNLANDLFDHYQGTDADKSIGGSRVIQEGKISLKSLWIAVAILYFLAGLMAIYITQIQDIWLLWVFIIFAFLSSVFYVAPPIKYGYRGFGELFVGINMGPIMVVGAYWAINSYPTWLAFWASLPIGIMVASILYYQNLPDMQSDKKAGKLTLAVRLGKSGAYWGMVILGLAIYISVVLLILFNIYPIYCLSILITIPLLFKLLEKIRNTKDWILLDQYGHLIRKIYLFNGIILIIGLILR
ncbi:MAG: 1,4-dihydroxy-2-naphthoate octaprenyltransferase [Planctomycetia bacterium]|nr:1,4-dihydroxy-2-naphthoate octaprenyltransferase [Planctomycetia bacterium]